jgi:hypothetical protein
MSATCAMFSAAPWPNSDGRPAEMFALGFLEGYSNMFGVSPLVVIGGI